MRGFVPDRSPAFMDGWPSTTRKPRSRLNFPNGAERVGYRGGAADNPEPESNGSLLAGPSLTLTLALTLRLASRASLWGASHAGPWRACSYRPRSASYRSPYAVQESMLPSKGPHSPDVDHRFRREAG